MRTNISRRNIQAIRQLYSRHSTTSTTSAPSASSSSFGIDLYHASKKHVAFLQAAHHAGVSTSLPSRHSFQRYEKCWLPLLASVHKERIGDFDKLIPPLDVAWIWHCHRLAPKTYAKACKDLYDVPVPLDNPMTSFLFAEKESDLSLISDARIEKIKFTRQLWEAKFPSEPFFIFYDTDNLPSYTTAEEGGITVESLPPQNNSSATDANRALLLQKGKELLFKVIPKKIKNKMESPDSSSNEEGQKDYGVINGFDVLAACMRQSPFLWQVSQPSFRQKDFLWKGVENYHKFLKLMKKHPDEFLVPHYQVKSERASY
jgi:hypothetical protein